ncbi:DUF3298 and DUF4163 domain-containing protein [Galbibacter sp. EGI 63066]|uniref:DUF3298 and DUF4163 domain-containing protein n=1 Tax=Galbibacter sp. EGI 63066 TaxID=2993559 RepID=UPI002248AD10|nr:DUF3298 and DUF4163 domain-containing protein [Galbibacter sp. EGI 63066]MCX2680574.1 DUF3298 and DUF4163 domain-containing protein [Galbibacter sp. EGI 63066]
MRSFFLFGALFLFLLYGCTDEPKISFIQQNLVESSCEECPQVTIDVPQAQGEDTAVAKINQEIHDYIIRVFDYTEENEISSIDDAVEAFKNGYQTLKKRFPDDIVSWQADITGDVVYRNKHLVSIRIENYMFTGGAHGYSYIYFLNFDINTGKVLEQSDLFTDLGAFTDLAEQIFRKQEGIEPEANINNSGFMFENDQFHLPNSIGFNEKGIELIYSPYEIAAYSDGFTTIDIPLEQVKEFIKPEWLDEVP